MSLQVQGLTELEGGLDALSREVLDLDAPHDVAALGVVAIQRYAPKRTGRLAGSGAVTTGPPVAVTAGGAVAPYAAAVNARTGFMRKVQNDMEAHAAGVTDRELQQRIERHLS